MADKKKYEKVKQAYRPDYADMFPGVVQRSQHGDSYAFCTVCRLDINISYGGVTDLKRHMETKKHQQLANAVSQTPKMSSFFTTDKGTNVIKAETLFAEFIVEHGIPISVSDHAGKLFRQMFPDSQIAQKYASGRTKTTHIIETLGAESKKKILNNIRQSPFSLATDASNDYEDCKLFPICIRYVCADTGIVLSVLLALKECTKQATGVNIYELIKEEMIADNVPWNNMIFFSTDNDSVMIGVHKGLAAYLTKDAPNLYIAGMLMSYILMLILS